eukprot:jgi/Mesvir1/12005/Mv00308-RA.2
MSAVAGDSCDRGPQMGQLATMESLARSLETRVAAGRAEHARLQDQYRDKLELLESTQALTLRLLFPWRGGNSSGQEGTTSPTDTVHAITPASATSARPEPTPWTAVHAHPPEPALLRTHPNAWSHVPVPEGKFAGHRGPPEATMGEPIIPGGGGSIRADAGGMPEPGVGSPHGHGAQRTPGGASPGRAAAETRCVEVSQVAHREAGGTLHVDVTLRNVHPRGMTLFGLSLSLLCAPLHGGATPHSNGPQPGFPLPHATASSPPLPAGPLVALSGWSSTLPSLSQSDGWQRLHASCHLGELAACDGSHPHATSGITSPGLSHGHMSGTYHGHMPQGSTAGRATVCTTGAGTGMGQGGAGHAGTCPRNGQDHSTGEDARIAAASLAAARDPGFGMDEDAMATVLVMVTGLGTFPENGSGEQPGDNPAREGSMGTGCGPWWGAGRAAAGAVGTGTQAAPPSRGPWWHVGAWHTDVGSLLADTQGAWGALCRSPGGPPADGTHRRGYAHGDDAVRRAAGGGASGALLSAQAGSCHGDAYDKSLDHVNAHVTTSASTMGSTLAGALGHVPLGSAATGIPAHGSGVPARDPEQSSDGDDSRHRGHSTRSVTVSEVVAGVSVGGRRNPFKAALAPPCPGDGAHAGVRAGVRVGAEPGSAGHCGLTGDGCRECVTGGSSPVERYACPQDTHAAHLILTGTGPGACVGTWLRHLKWRMRTGERGAATCMDEWEDSIAVTSSAEGFTQSSLSWRLVGEGTAAPTQRPIGLPADQTTGLPKQGRGEGTTTAAQSAPTDEPSREDASAVDESLGGPHGAGSAAFVTLLAVSEPQLRALERDLLSALPDNILPRNTPRGHTLPSYYDPSYLLLPQSI